MMQGYYVKKLGQHRGAPRVWLEGTAAERAGFVPGQRYDVLVEENTIVLQANPDGSRIVSGKVIGERNNPVIDLNSRTLLAMFDGMAAIRVVVKEGEIFLLPLASELKKRERFGRLRGKLERGEPLLVGSLSHGGGVLSHALHAGLQTAGIDNRLAFANDIRGELLEQAANHNDSWSEKTSAIAAPMQELAFDDRGVASIPKIEVLEMGLPCSGASRPGRSKRGLVHAESHPEVGHLVVSALIIVGKCNPAVVVMENVPDYAMTASAEILRSQFRDLGYVTHERVLRGEEWNCLEARNRWCMVAVTEGIEFDFDQLQPPMKKALAVGDALDTSIGPDDPRWGSFDYLKAKEARDSQKVNNGFRMQVVHANDSTVPALRKGYHKGGSTDPYLAHPENPELMRKFTSAEHARIKGVPQTLVEGLSETIAHQVLGQSVVYAPFKDVGTHVGNALSRFAGREVIENAVAQRSQGGVLMSQNANETARQDGKNAPAPQEVVAAGPKQLDLLGGGAVTSGRYVGKILEVADGLATQKINRAGETVKHDLKNLAATPKVGDMLEIAYEGGKGRVIVRGKSMERDVRGR